MVEAFLQELATEHELLPGSKNTDDTECIIRSNVYFDETSKESKLRGLMIDIGSTYLDSFKNSSAGKLFPNQNIFNFNGNSEGRFSVYRLKLFENDKVMNAFRKEVEKCDSLQAVQMFHHLGEGVGSGIGKSLLNSMMEQEFTTYINHAILPEISNESVPEAMYNSILSLSYLIENSQLTNLYSYKGIANVSKLFSYPVDGVKLLGKVISDFTSVTRFSGQSNSNFFKMCQSISPFPRLHFATVNFCHRKKETDSIKALFDEAYNLADYHFKKPHKFLSTQYILRGDFHAATVQKTSKDIFKSSNGLLSYIQNVPCNLFQYNYVDVERKEGMSSLGVVNNTNVRNLMSQYNLMQEKFWNKQTKWEGFTKDGMDEMELIESASNVTDLCSEYESNEQYTVRDDELEDD